MKENAKVMISPHLDVSTNGVIVYIKSFVPCYNSTMIVSIDELERIVKFVRENSQQLPELLTPTQLYNFNRDK